MLVRHAEDLWTVWQQHSFFGLRLGTRMTVVRLPTGVLIHSPVKLTSELARGIDSLGPVKHIVCPNLYHHVYALEWTARYDRAVVHAPAALARKRPDLRIDRNLEGMAPADWEGALVPIHIDGCLLDETVFVHPKSRSIISADLTENFVGCDHWWTRQYLKIGGIYQRIGWSRPLRLLYTDRARAARSIERLLQFDADRIIVAHGSIIEGGARAAIEETFAFL